MSLCRTPKSTWGKLGGGLLWFQSNQKLYFKELLGSAQPEIELIVFFSSSNSCAVVFSMNLMEKDKYSIGICKPPTNALTIHCIIILECFPILVKYSCSLHLAHKLKSRRYIFHPE